MVGSGMTPEENAEWDAFMASTDDAEQPGEAQAFPVAAFGDPDDFTFDPEASVVDQPAVQHSVAKALAKCFSKATLTQESWINEVHMISRAAAASGKFDTALNGYKMLAPSLGVKTEPQTSASQHVHFHSADALAEQSTEALMQRQEEIRQKRAHLHTIDAEED